MRETMLVDGLTLCCDIIDQDAPLIVNHGAIELTLANETGANILTIDGIDWTRDLTPWLAPNAALRGAMGGANRHCARIIDTLLPNACARWSLRPRSVYMMGYSLAGLFALFAGVETTVFDGVASVSGLLWYPDFMSFLETKTRFPKRVYLSLGEREERSRNPLFQTVGKNTRALFARLSTLGVDATYVENPGGHFDHPEERMARAAKWLVQS